MHLTDDDLRRSLRAPQPLPDSVDRLTHLIVELAADVDRRDLRDPYVARTSNASRRRTGGRSRHLVPAAAAAMVIIGIASTVGLLIPRTADPDRSGTTLITTARPATVAGSQLVPVWLVSDANLPGFTVTRDEFIRLGVGSDTEEGGIITPKGAGRASGTFTLEPEQENDYARFVENTPGGMHLTVNDHDAYFVPGKHVGPGRLNPAIYAQPWQAAANSSRDQPTVAVQHAHGRWTLIAGTFGFKPATYDYDNTTALAVMKSIDQALRVGVAHRVMVPFRLHDLPHHLVPEATNLLRGVPCLGYGTGRGPYPGEYVGSVMTVCRLKTYGSRTSIQQRTGIDSTQAGATIVRPLKDGTSLVVEVDGGQLGLISQAEAERLADNADIRPTQRDTSTWFTVP